MDENEISKDLLNKELSAQLLLEIGILHHYYKRDTKALAFFQQAQKMTGLQWNLTGVLGKRTKFQQFETSQLVLEASSDLNANQSTATPQNLDLNDDTLLDKIQLSSEYSDKDALNGNLNPIDQSILLGYWFAELIQFKREKHQSK
jgi:hypothetical protein